MDLDRQNNSQESSSIKKCVMINECLDLNHQMDDFFDKYFFIYEDCQKPDAILQGRAASSNVRLLTKNDLYRYYAINKVISIKSKFIKFLICSPVKSVAGIQTFHPIHGFFHPTNRVYVV